MFTCASLACTCVTRWSIVAFTVLGSTKGFELPLIYSGRRLSSWLASRRPSPPFLGSGTIFLAEAGFELTDAALSDSATIRHPVIFKGQGMGWKTTTRGAACRLQAGKMLTVKCAWCLRVLEWVKVWSYVAIICIAEILNRQKDAHKTL